MEKSVKSSKITVGYSGGAEPLVGGPKTLRVGIKSIPDATTPALLGSAMIIGGLFLRRKRLQV